MPTEVVSCKNGRRVTRVKHDSENVNTFSVLYDIVQTYFIVYISVPAQAGSIFLIAWWFY